MIPTLQSKVVFDQNLDPLVVLKAFENACHSDKLSVGYQNLIRQHLLEKEHHGMFTGQIPQQTHQRGRF